MTRPSRSLLALVVIAYPEDESRLGEVAFIPEGEGVLLGRDAQLGVSGGGLLVFGRQRPGSFEPRGPLGSRTLSRRQTIFRARTDSVEIDNIGQAPIAIDGGDPRRAHIGTTISLGETVLLACTRRPLHMPPLEHFPVKLVPDTFGAPDGLGFVGESSLAWEMRESFARAAPSSRVLVRGVSGSGRGFAAGLIHALSPRREMAPVFLDARSTTPAELAQALARVEAERSSLILEHAEAPAADASSLVQDALSSARDASILLTIDPRADVRASPWFDTIDDVVEVPSMGARIEDAWCWLRVPAGRPTEPSTHALEVDTMARLVTALRRRGSSAIPAFR